jgi:hypothetical protein
VPASVTQAKDKTFFLICRNNGTSPGTCFTKKVPVPVPNETENLKKRTNEVIAKKQHGKIKNAEGVSENHVGTGKGTKWRGVPVRDSV